MDATKIVPTLAPLALAVTLLGCQASIPNELADARAAYRHAEEGPASTYDPAALHKAYKTLELAEKTYNVEGDTAATRDRAYVATRQAQLATVKARVVQTQQELDKLQAHKDRAQGKALEQAQDQITKTQSELTAEREARQRAEEARQRAEEFAEQARRDLAEFATVKQDSRGTVITLTGEVLFQLGKSELRGPARARLALVAQSLNTSYPDQPIRVVGHTDNQGSDKLNERLSEKRAQSVADFLAQQGVADDRITAVGKGESEPVASNDTPEGRANNRRVEIVVGSGGASQGSEMSGDEGAHDDGQ